jgi:hypothetical protein
MTQLQQTKKLNYALLLVGLTMLLFVKHEITYVMLKTKTFQGVDKLIRTFAANSRIAMIGHVQR